MKAIFLTFGIIVILNFLSCYEKGSQKSIIPDSDILSGLTWLGPQVPCPGSYKADTYPLTWADDEKLEGYLLFSGSWRNGGSSEFYRVHVRRFRLERAGKNI
jgi:hypothetical protein